MILAAALAAPALAQPVSGAQKVGFADIFGWGLPVAGAGPRPAVIGLHACDGQQVRRELDARERAKAELLRARLSRPLARTVHCELHGAIDWLAARADVDRARIVVLGWSHGGTAHAGQPPAGGAAPHPARRAR